MGVVLGPPGLTWPEEALSRAALVLPGPQSLWRGWDSGLGSAQLEEALVGVGFRPGTSVAGRGPGFWNNFLMLRTLDIMIGK